MLSKFLRPLGPPVLRAARAPLPPPARARSDLLPPTQYDLPIPNRLKLGYAMRVYWEIIPVVFVTVFTFTLTTLSTLWACANKVDVSFGTHNQWATISRTMDLRNPSTQKIIVINQRYEPWPEMQTVLDKMTAAEKRARVRAQTCSNP